MAASTKKTLVFLLLLLLAALMVDAQLAPGDDDAKQMGREPGALPVPAPCYSTSLPNCTDSKCKQFCAGAGKPPVPGAVCNDKSNCCCPVG